MYGMVAGALPFHIGSLDGPPKVCDMMISGTESGSFGQFLYVPLVLTHTLLVYVHGYGRTTMLLRQKFPSPSPLENTALDLDAIRGCKWQLDSIHAKIGFWDVNAVSGPLELLESFGRPFRAAKRALLAKMLDLAFDLERTPWSLVAMYLTHICTIDYRNHHFCRFLS